MSGIVENLKQLIGRVADFSLPLKMLVGALIGILGGSGFLGLLSEYAAYGYAIGYGFRPPMEGIPYLRATVTLLSFFLLAGGAIAFTLIYGVGRVILMCFVALRHVAGMRDSDPEYAKFQRSGGSIQSMHVLPFIGFALATALFSGLWLTGVFFLFQYFIDLREPPPVHACLMTVSPWVLGFSAGVLGVPLVFLIRWPKLVWWYSAAAAVLLLVGGPALFFNQGFYGRFLRLTGYGGGLAVTINLESSEHKELGGVNYSGGLMLRTSESVFLYLPESSEIFEIPLPRIRTIQHPAGKFGVRKTYLPAAIR